MAQRRSTYKGERKQVNVPLPIDFYDEVSAKAEALGLTRPQYLLHALCLAADRPELDPVNGRHHDERHHQMQMTA